MNITVENKFGNIKKINLEFEKYMLLNLLPLLVFLVPFPDGNLVVKFFMSLILLFAAIPVFSLIFYFRNSFKVWILGTFYSIICSILITIFFFFIGFVFKYLFIISTVYIFLILSTIFIIIGVILGVLVFIYGTFLLAKNSNKILIKKALNKKNKIIDTNINDLTLNKIKSQKYYFKF